MGRGRVRRVGSGRPAAALHPPSDPGDALSGIDTPPIVVGGAGSRTRCRARKTQVKDPPTFPEAFIPLANGMGKSLDELRERSDVKRTYISPAADFRPKEYAPAPTSPARVHRQLRRQRGFISYADFAIAVVDEAES